MSWIGGLNDSFNQLSSLTGQLGGQLTTFTKEVLAEESSEIIDHEAEVKRLKIKLIEAEAAINEYEVQVAKQKQSFSALEEQYRSSELQAHSRKLEYETTFEKQNVEGDVASCHIEKITTQFSDIQSLRASSSYSSYFLAEILSAAVFS
ncbi:unnamed protein product [Clavelina lepadiformis]|uniref:Uncharacterized protein n=1 Tax=Clavelina lepadiformis TaxID=159417 RepID=A0ABP0FND4_CLALP